MHFGTPQNSIEDVAQLNWATSSILFFYIIQHRHPHDDRVAYPAKQVWYLAKHHESQYCREDDL